MALIASMIIHLVLLIVADLTYNHRDFLSPVADIEINLIRQLPKNTINESVIIPIQPIQKDLSASKSTTLKSRSAPKKIITSKSQTELNVPKPEKNPRNAYELKKEAASVKADPSPKKIITINSNQILEQIRQTTSANFENNKSSLRSKTISATTTDYEYRLYFEAWRQKVERIGALNYPEAAKSGILGALRLTVLLNPDGDIDNILIDKSSGHSELDEAAISIVKMGAPYSKFSNRMKNEVDIIKITRTWKFTDQNQFSTQ